MKIIILTLFPEMINSVISESIVGRSIKNNILDIQAINIRDYAYNKHSKVDDYPYSGGAGMLMQAEPVYQAIIESKKLLSDNVKVIYMSPKGRVLNQKVVEKMALDGQDYIFLCGHYEGIDERVLEECVDDYISVGDYVLTGGELPALILADAIIRFIPGVLNNEESTKGESHQSYLLEHPQYSRPRIWHEKEVPEVLLSGNHKNIEKWKLEKSIEITKRYRPDMYEQYISSIQ